LFFFVSRHGFCTFRIPVSADNKLAVVDSKETRFWGNMEVGLNVDFNNKQDTNVTYAHNKKVTVGPGRNNRPLSHKMMKNSRLHIQKTKIDRIQKKKTVHIQRRKIGRIQMDSVDKKGRLLC
jgi:hypothetical protein